LIVPDAVHVVPTDHFRPEPAGALTVHAAAAVPDFVKSAAVRPVIGSLKVSEKVGPALAGVAAPAIDTVGGTPSVRAATARAALTMPLPHPRTWQLDPPLAAPTGVAVSRSSSATSSGVIAGRAAMTRAALAATWGAAIEVPL
jgi:hypothetical protein